MTHSKPSICIIAQNAYGAMCGGDGGHIGGVERQTSLIARWLARQGYPVTVVTWGWGQREGVEVDGVRVVPLCREDAGCPGLRFFHPRLTSLYRALRLAEAQVYYHNSAEAVTGLIAAWCRWQKRKFVFSLASNSDCEPSLPVLARAYERILYRFGLRHADRVVAQTQQQQRQLKRSFGKASVVLPMPCAGPSGEDGLRQAPPAVPRVVWVGRLASMKRLELMLDVAESVPQFRFEIAAANRKRCAEQPRLGDYGDSLYQRAQRLPNVIWHDSVPRERMPDIYRNATCLCCTSSYEGFPNTFLEAWGYGLPVVTSFDPDGLVARKRLGLVANDRAEFVTALESLVHTPHMWSEVSQNSRAYFREHHAIEVAMPRFEQQFLEVAGCCGAGGVTLGGPERS